MAQQQFDMKAEEGLFGSNFIDNTIIPTLEKEGPLPPFVRDAYDGLQTIRFLRNEEVDEVCKQYNARYGTGTTEAFIASKPEFYDRIAAVDNQYLPLFIEYKSVIDTVWKSLERDRLAKRELMEKSKELADREDFNRAVTANDEIEAWSQILSRKRLVRMR